ncbi:MAG TPA: alkaline phosphatase family protein [Terriglobales bacterium]|nr:alkaline phosphatase family protein [Terriglobales bacterium]
MHFVDLNRATWRYVGMGAALLSTMVNLVDPPSLAAQTARTATPIKHVIVIIGENRSFDHVFATFRAKNGETVSNLLSKGIIQADGTPGPNYSQSAQYSAVDSDTFSISPDQKTVYANIPPVVAGGPTTPFLPSIGLAKQIEPGLLPGNTYKLLTTGGTGLTAFTVPDTRIANVMNLGEGAFQLTPSVSYDDYANSPVHRFYQMWQQLDCNAALSTQTNPSGCSNDLFPWVETTIGAGSDGSSGSTSAPTNYLSTGEGSTAMEFYNMQKGDARYFRSLADTYTLSDNFHQSVMGGTGANHIMFGFADAIWYSDGKGNAATPPATQIENPNPQPGTNNWYDADGYSGGSYSNCADLSQPGVPAVVNYLESLPRPVSPNCDAGHYYLLNNYNPGFNADGTLATSTAFTIPPSAVRHIGDALLEKNISWKYYGDGWNVYLTDPTQANPFDTYCTICNPFQYATDIMSDSTLRTTHIQDAQNIYTDIKAGALPAVSIVKPGWPTDGHPASSKLDLFENFTKKIVEAVQADSTLWANTAIFITFDEGGGYYDSGYVQPVDFFGDGTRIPLLIVSPFTQGGHVNHTYGDHVSITKFIERNWKLAPLTARSRDNLPNPKVKKDNPYVPTNSPAIGDLFDAFDFKN